MLTAAKLLHLLYLTSVAVLAALTVLRSPLPAVRKWAPLALRVSVALGFLGMAARALYIGHLPIFGTFENTYMASWALLVFALVAQRYSDSVDWWALMSPWSLVLLLYGTRFRSGPVPLTISEKSLWVDVHVTFAWAAFACLIAVTTLSLRRLFKVEGKLAEDEFALLHQRLLLAGFVALTAMLATGAWYLYLLFGTFWKWEVVESLSLVAWLSYGMIVHARLFYRWNGPWYHGSVVAVLPVLLLAFWIWSVFPGTYHFFDIPLVRPY